MLRFENISKRYGDRVLFERLHFAAGAGCVALCDENGGGKSTLLGILAGTIEADEGEVWLGGHSLRSAPREAKAALAFVPDDCMTYPDLTGQAFLESVALEKKTAVDGGTLDLAHRFGLAPHMEKRFEQMSYGTRKKLFLTAATLGAVAVVIVDDPISGLDAAARGVVVDLFKSLGQTRAVFFSSHDLELANACDARATTFADLAKAG